MTFDIYEIYLFNKSGALIAENIIENNINNQNSYKKVFPRLIKATASYNIKNNKLINHNIYFLQQRKIITVNFSTANVISLAVCANETKSKLVYFFLLKVTMSYLNYMKMHNCNTTYNIHSVIYETIFLSPIKNHYSLSIKEVFRRYTLYINNISYKNFYLIDLCSDEVILSLESIFDQNKNGYVETKIPDKLIWNDILYHSHILKNDYIKKNKNIFQIEILQEFYTKIEIKATYPRLIYIIKFLPLLGGLTLVYEYYQHKMSRIDNSENKFEEYSEYSVQYGYEFDEEDNFKTKNDEFLLNEPDVLIHIHFFIIECLLCNLDNINFFVFNKYQKIYFSDEILQLVNKQIYSNIKLSQVTDIVKNKEFLHNLLGKIVNDLYEEYLQINTQKEQSQYSATVYQPLPDENTLNKSFFLSYPDSLYITKKFTLNTIFKKGQLDHYINKNDISLNLSSEEETSFTDDVYQTLREKNDFNQFNDPYFYYRYHYANASVESRRLMDLLNDNVSINENQGLLNINKKLLMTEHNDLNSLNNNDIFKNINNLPKINFRINPYKINNYNNNEIMETNMNYYHNNFYRPSGKNNKGNASASNSHVPYLLNIPKMKRK